VLLLAIEPLLDITRSVPEMPPYAKDPGPIPEVGPAMQGPDRDSKPLGELAWGEQGIWLIRSHEHAL
jgi:hypothetical protein